MRALYRGSEIEAAIACSGSKIGVYPDWIHPILLDTDSSVTAFAGDADPWENLSEYVQLSAVFHLNKVTTPMLLAVGDKDQHDFVLGTIEMFNGLRRLRRDVTLLRYPNQGHGFTGESLKDFWERELEFFDSWLKPREGTGSGSNATTMPGTFSPVR